MYVSIFRPLFRIENNVLAEDFSTGNNQYSGPRPEPLEEKVPILDPSTSPRGQGNCEGQVGRADRDSGFGQMGNDEGGIYGTDGQIEVPFFFMDGERSGYEPFGIYVRATEEIIGDEKYHDFVPPDLGTSRCFNCGLPDHTVSACPTPLDRQLISLSRQLFHFNQAARGIIDFQRIHIVEEWRQQRLQWLNIFEPGEICSALLQDAIGSNGGDWLKNMAVWGYPKGWVGITDPRDHIRELIKKEHADDWNDNVEDLEPFIIFGDGDEVETIYPNCIEPGTPSDNAGSDSDSDTIRTSLEESMSDLEPNDTTRPQPTRWAHYPPTQFASHLLPVYTGAQLPPISHPGSSTYNTDRQDLWQRIISGGESSRGVDSTLSIPGVFDASPSASQHSTEDRNPIPPAPTTEPPPLPPSPPSDTQAPPRRVVPSRSDDCDDSDMDMSD